MPLRFRDSPSERVLRSVDETPGVVGVYLREDGTLTFMVHTGIVPGVIDRDRAVVGVVADVRQASQAVLDGLTEIDVDDALAACEGPTEIRMLARYAASQVAQTTALVVPRFDFEVLRDACEFAIAVRDGAIARFPELG